MKISSLRARNLRAFVDTESVNFDSLNVFIGPNNAGKTTLIGAIELLARSLSSGGRNGPLAFIEMPAFASFDAAVRRHWSKNERRPNEIKLTYGLGDEQEAATAEFSCVADAGSGATRVSRATYKKNDKTAKILSNNLDAGSKAFSGSFENDTYPAGSVSFHSIWPIFHSQKRASAYLLSFSAFGFEDSWWDGRYRYEIVKPFRPVPRSYYVLDDPNIATEELALVSYLANLWETDEKSSEEMRERIRVGLSLLGLTTTFEVIRLAQKRGPSVLEIRVSPHTTRQKVTIADAGFGLSQALPLVVSDARLNSGTLIAYQPEVHLHPFAQSRLADLFVNSVNRGNQVFVETHSPDMILRLQTLISQGTISSDRVGVFCLENRKGKPRITKIKFDERAKPEIPWPEGFLDTSLTLAKELTSSRLKSLK